MGVNICIQKIENTLWIYLQLKELKAPTPIAYSEFLRQKNLYIM